MKRRLKSLVTRLIHFVLANRILKTWAVTAINRFPKLKEKLRRLAFTAPSWRRSERLQIPTELILLTPRARRVLSDIQAAFRAAEMRD